MPEPFIDRADSLGREKRDVWVRAKYSRQLDKLVSARGIKVRVNVLT